MLTKTRRQFQTASVPVSFQNINLGVVTQHPVMGSNRHYLLPPPPWSVKQNEKLNSEMLKVQVLPSCLKSSSPIVSLFLLDIISTMAALCNLFLKLENTLLKLPCSQNRYCIMLTLQEGFLILKGIIPSDRLISFRYGWMIYCCARLIMVQWRRAMRSRLL